MLMQSGNNFKNNMTLNHIIGFSIQVKNEEMLTRTQIACFNMKMRCDYTHSMGTQKKYSNNVYRQELYPLA